MKHDPLAQAFHWLTVILVLAGAALGLSMVDLQAAAQKSSLYAWHRSIGLTVFLLTGLRFLWRLVRIKPPMPRSVPEWQRYAARISHWGMYALLLVIPLSGWLMSSAAGAQVLYLGAIPLPDLVDEDKELFDGLRVVHLGLNCLFGLVVALHIAAALKHHFVDRDEVLVRMLPFARRPRRAAD